MLRTNPPIHNVFNADNRLPTLATNDPRSTDQVRSKPASGARGGDARLRSADRLQRSDQQLTVRRPADSWLSADLRPLKIPRTGSR